MIQNLVLLTLQKAIRQRPVANFVREQGCVFVAVQMC